MTRRAARIAALTLGPPAAPDCGQSRHIALKENRHADAFPDLLSPPFWAPPALPPPLSAETVKLTLLGVGDVYNFEEEDGRGGFARLNAVARAERAANPNTLYVFNGDMLSPSLASGFDHGAEHH